MKETRSDIGERLKQYRKDNNLSVPALEKLLSIPRDRIYKWEKGTVPYDTADYEKVEDLINGKYGKMGIPQATTNDIINDVVQHTGYYYPNVNASAGLSFLTDNSEEKAVPVVLPSVDAKIYINVFGDSMYPKYCSGEIVGIKEVDKDYIMYGQAYVVLLKDGEAYLKYIKKGKDANHITLASENPLYEPKEFHLSKIDKIFIIKAVITKTTLV